MKRKKKKKFIMTHQSFIKAKKNNQTRDKYTMKNIYKKKKAPKSIFYGKK